MDIINYYSSIDKNIINNLCKNDYIKNLIKLSVLIDINIFDIKNNVPKIKNENKLLKECNNIKKKEIKNAKNILNILKLKNNNDINNIKNIYNNLNKIENINKIINYINENNNYNKDNKFEKKFIEYYSNC